jgi:hypothetical protein
MSTAAEVTDSIIRPPTALLGPEAAARARQRLSQEVPALVDRLPSGDQVVVSLAQLRRLGSDPTPGAGVEDPFAWKPRFVRRSLGLAAIGACLDGRARSPHEAVGPVADRAVDEWERSGWRTFHWEPWFAALGGGARAAVLAESATWATQLWTSLDWRRFRPPPRLGGPDDQWACPAPRTVHLKGRSELRVVVPGDAGSPPGTVLVSVSGGSPRPDCEVELGYLALVAALRSPSRPVPARVVGLWPDTARHVVVDITEEVLDDAGTLVLGGLEAMVSDAATGLGAPADGEPDGHPAGGSTGDRRAVPVRTGAAPG